MPKKIENICTLDLILFLVYIIHVQCFCYHWLGYSGDKQQNRFRSALFDKISQFIHFIGQNITIYPHFKRLCIGLGKCPDDMGGGGVSFKSNVKRCHCTAQTVSLQSLPGVSDVNMRWDTQHTLGLCSANRVEVPFKFSISSVNVTHL